MRGLDAITFDATNLALQGDHDNKRIWMSAAGDMVTLYDLPKPADFRAIAAEIEIIRTKSRNQAAQYGGAIVEVELCEIGGLAAVREILKIPQKPTGMGYMGSFMLPCADSAYLLTVACPERGITGVRDMAVFAQLMQSGEVKFEEGAAQPANWMRDPYDPAIAGPPARNRADDEAYDVQFPEHPLSRVRNLLGQIGISLRISDVAKGS
jgi:hypothetical protein